MDILPTAPGAIPRRCITEKLRKQVKEYFYVRREIKIVSAPSILGLWPSGVETLADTLLSKQLREKLNSEMPVGNVPVLNDQYESTRDKDSGCLNTMAIRKFSETLASAVGELLSENYFPLVLGGDCSILIGAMPAMKKIYHGGLIFIDAHADFYAPLQSTTGQVADMDLAIVTGRGPEKLTNIDGLSPYVPDSKVLHIAQRDQDETKEYGSQEIRETAITCLDLDTIQSHDIEHTKTTIQNFLTRYPGEKFWIHFDTDCLDDAINPAVDYRLPGGLSLTEARFILTTLLDSNLIAGMSVTIFNPSKDPTGEIAEMLVDLFASVLTSRT